MSRWQEIPSGRMGFGYEQAREAGVPWAWIRPLQRPLHEINAEQEARKKAAQEADERAQKWLAASPCLRTKAEVAADAAARAQAKEARILMQARMTYHKRMAAFTKRTPLTVAEHERRTQALRAVTDLKAR